MSILHSSVHVVLTLFVSMSIVQTVRAETESVSRSILDLYQTQDVIVFGEMHVLREAREILVEVLRDGFSSGEITGFATEYIHERNEDAFQDYIESFTATRNSPEEEEFFASISDSGFIWADDEANRDFFRFLRDQKLRHGDSIAICGLDVTPSNHYTGSDEEEIEVRRARFGAFPPELLSHASDVFQKTKAEMISAVGYNYDREPMMALRAADCLKSSRKNLVHVGAFHAWSLDYSQPSNNWATTSHFLKTTMPDSGIVTVYHYQHPNGRSSELDEFEQRIFDATTEVLRFNSGSSFFKNSRIPELARDELTLSSAGQSYDLSQIWDYFIFGPPGTHVDFWR